MLKHDSSKTLMNSEQRNISDYMPNIFNVQYSDDEIQNPH